jgi:hypothetical protein
MAEDASKQAVAVSRALAVGHGRSAAPRCSAKRLVLGVLVRMLFALVELALELLRLLLVGERERCQAVFKLKSVEEDTVLVIGEGIVYLLVPQDTTVGRLNASVSHLARAFLGPTDMSTSLSQKVFPTKSFARTAAP